MFFTSVVQAMRLLRKSKFYFLGGGALLILLVASILSAYFGGRQPGIVSLDVGISLFKVIVPFLLVFLVQDLIFNEVDRRYYLVSITYPMARLMLLVGRCVAIFMYLIVLFFSFVLLQLFIVWLVGLMYPQYVAFQVGWGYFSFLIFMLFDFLVIFSVAVFLGVSASTSSFVLVGTLGFMIVARSYGVIVDLISRESGLVKNADGYKDGLGMLSYFFPDLGGLDVRGLALYNRVEFLPSDWVYLIAACLLYTVALFVAAMLFLKNKKFS
jgi:Cu-processing system permease protein